VKVCLGLEFPIYLYFREPVLGSPSLAGTPCIVALTSLRGISVFSFALCRFGCHYEDPRSFVFFKVPLQVLRGLRCDHPLYNYIMNFTNKGKRAVRARHPRWSGPPFVQPLALVGPFRLAASLRRPLLLAFGQTPRRGSPLFGPQISSAQELENLDEA
jgi:hypothetical protein